MSGDVCAVRTWQGEAHSWQGMDGPEMLPHIPTVPRVAPHPTENDLALNVSSAGVEKA